MANIKPILMLMLAAQFSTRSQYKYATDYLTRDSPYFNPFPGITVPDNACQRSFYGSREC
jgi:hypothetical protein